jgi:NAD(P)-dependent dehydrogenase (short-subunit alcohol dehydrogenase family)
MAALDGKVAVITGGTGALGSAVSAAFVGAGAKVVATYIVDEEAAALRAALPAGCLEVVKVDLTDAAALGECMRRVLAAHGRIDVLLNLAGGFWGGVPIAETPARELERMLAMNLTTAFLCSRAVLPAMIAQRAGRIVNVAARAALVGGANVGAYAIAKAGVATLTRVLAEETREHGITVNAIAPSTIDTPANRAAMPAADHGRWVAPATIAATLVFLASDAAAATSGAIVPVYGAA